MIFDDASVARDVANALAVNAAIPPDHRGAFVTVTNDTGVRAVLAERLQPGSDAWTITGYIDHPWVGGLEYGATVQKTW